MPRGRRLPAGHKPTARRKAGVGAIELASPAGPPAPAPSQAIAAPVPRPGRLVLVVGPSGGGKDTLLAAARATFAGEDRLVFPRRAITRPEQIGEDHIPVSRREFNRLAAAGDFYLSWQAHSLSYGVPAAIAEDLAQGRTVVVNVSRTVIAAACQRWPDTLVVHVTVALDVLRARLLQRGRESESAIAERLGRSPAAPTLPAVPTVVIDNNGPVGPAVRRFNALLADYAGAAYAGLREKR